LAWLLTPSLARAQAPPPLVVNFDENGNGNIVTPAGINPLRSLGNIVDPFDPNNGLRPLGYDLTGSPGIGVLPRPGDINLIETPGTTTASDLVRFFQGLIIVYSDIETGDPHPGLADVGLPVARQTNLITLPQTGPEDGPNGMFGYTPNDAQPGFLVGFAGAQYNFTSDAVPEPASVVILGTGVAIGGLFWYARRRRAG
jgi:hypothetical protein